MTSDEALLAVIDALDRLGLPYLLTGSLASNFHLYQSINEVAGENGAVAGRWITIREMRLVCCGDEAWISRTRHQERRSALD